MKGQTWEQVAADYRTLKKRIEQFNKKDAAKAELFETRDPVVMQDILTANIGSTLITADLEYGYTLQDYKGLEVEFDMPKFENRGGKDLTMHSLIYIHDRNNRCIGRLIDDGKNIIIKDPKMDPGKSSVLATKPLIEPKKKEKTR